MPTNEELLDLLVTTLPTAAARVTRPERRFTTAPELTAALAANDDAVTASLRPVLLAALPGSQWTAEEHGAGPMPAGDWWVVDPVGGNLNAIQGTPDWNIGVSLVRDGDVVLAALHAPAVSEMFTALNGAGATLNGAGATLNGAGATLNGASLTVSAKTELALALTGTGQARPSTDPTRADLRGRAIAAMMRSALSVRQSIPVGQHLTHVAAGRADVHWQFENLRSHIAPVLIAREAGATVTDLDGAPWAITSEGYVAAAPGVHAAALTILGSLR
ncbi:myo-inositol-1(or 4)-monophosphatase [Kineococcus radiotolerans]|uniref:Myo-inositol-1(Or 4)-monophosphatase n=1 Tax=Kineococcus radiotolerans TaxID=131568 RepID=A0A7W4THZ7_KINRA|nr:inositol monophosphatase family protein [Kineococcus radiotolerans]MBB2899264.1 myo-inositol-1(or 4)-monophosphatase [Kineococcus radiotolerans]